MSLKQAAKLRLPAPASTEAARRELVMHLLARRKLQFVPTRDHPDGVLVETAHDVLSDDDLSCMRDVLASCALGCCSAQKNSSALDTLVAEFQVQEEQHAYIYTTLVHTYACAHADVYSYIYVKLYSCGHGCIDHE